MQNKSIVILAGKGESSNILFHAFNSEFNIVKVIEEEPVDQKTFLKKRIAKLGWRKVFGQILFVLIIVRILRVTSKSRIAEIKQNNGFNDALIPVAFKTQVSSINSPEAIAALQRLKPDLVIVNGTRIISKKVLESVQVPFINTHAGITPLYRGVHGGYWALANQDKANCGVTVHLVDTGIDTGNILEQALINPSKEDNFITYPLLQLATGLLILKKAISDALTGKLTIKNNPEGKSCLWYHPTIMEYLLNRFKYKVK